MLQIPFFDDVGAVTLAYFDSLFQRDNLQKSQFYKNLPKVLPKLPKVSVHCVCGECVALTGHFSVLVVHSYSRMLHAQWTGSLERGLQ